MFDEINKEKNSEVWQIAFLTLFGCALVFFIVPLFANDYAATLLDNFRMVVTGAFWLVIIGSGTLVYFIPTFIAHSRKHHNTVPILLVNIFFGFIAIGWIIALIWAFTAVNPNLRKA